MNTRVDRPTSRLVTTAAIALLGLAGTAAAADSYTATMIPNIPGGTATIGHGVNDAGMVVGQADDELGQVVGFFFQNGQSRALPLLAGGSEGRAVSVNSSGVIVGECRNAAGISRAVKWERDQAGQYQISDLGTLAAGDAGLGVATRINDAGVIVGYATVSVPGPYHAVRWDGAVKTDLGTLGYMGNFAYSQALGINNAGDITGFAYATLQGPEHGMLVPGGGGRAEDITPAVNFGLAQWHNVNSAGTLAGFVSGSGLTNGHFRPAVRTVAGGIVLLPLIDTLTDGYGYDLNDAGVVVGEMFLPQPAPDEGVFAAFKFENGATADLGEISTGLTGALTQVKDVSNTGLIAGTANTGAGPQAVLLTPVAACRADFNQDRAVTVQDIFDFLAAYFSNDPDADFNGEGGITVQDIFDFLSAYFTGCTV